MTEFKFFRGSNINSYSMKYVVHAEMVQAQAEITRLNAIIKENEADKWISVEDRFPERIEGNKILCFNNDYIFECVYEDDNWCNIFGETFTHWQPLLQPPAMRVKGE